MKFRALLLALAAASPALAQTLVPYEDVHYLQDGGFLRGRIVADDGETLKIREAGSTAVRQIPRSRVIRTKSKADVYLEEGRAAADKGEFETALAYFGHLPGDLAEGEPRRAAAELGIESVYYEATRQGRVVVVRKDGRVHVGDLVDRGDVYIVVTASGAAPFVPRAAVEKILRHDDLLLARGDRLTREGKPEEAVEEYRRLRQRHDSSSDPLAEVGTGRLGRTCRTLGQRAFEAGRLDEACEHLRDAARLLFKDKEIQAELARAEEARARQRDEKARAARAILERARALFDEERHPEALRVVEEAAAEAPWLEDVKDLRREIQDELLLLVCAEVDLPRDFRPVVGASASEERAARLLFEALVEEDEAGRVLLSLAETVEVGPDDRAYTFRLPPEAIWSDGKPLTALDVQFSAAAWADPRSERRWPGLARYVERTEVLDPHRVRFHLARRHPEPLRLFGFPILPRHAVGSGTLDRDNPFFRQPIVSGPYAVGELREREAIFYKNLHYRRSGRPRVYGIVFRHFPDGTAAGEALRRGEVDAWPEATPGALADLAGAPDDFRILGGGHEVEILLFNHRHPILAKSGVRRAIGRGLPVEAALRERVEDAEGTVPARALATGPFEPGSWRSDPEVRPWKYEPAYGRELLRETLRSLGYRLEVGTPLAWMKGEEKLSLRIVHPAGDPGIARACRKLASGIEELGIEPRVEALEAEEFDRRVRVGHDFDLAWVRLRSEDLDELAGLFDPAERGPGGSNAGGYLNPSLIERLHTLGKTLEPGARARGFREIHSLLAEDAFALFLWRVERRGATTRRVVPAGSSPRGFFRRIEDWRLVTFD